MNSEGKREVWIDWMRVIACFMVMIVHSTEPFYLGGDGGQILTESDMYWAAFFDSSVRMCVPLFVIASSYLQFPLHYSTADFFRKRAVRILVPFAVWSLAYALYWGEPAENLKGLLFNFNYAAGHLWFVYMLIGVYLIMPMLSPWAEKVGKKELKVYIGIWLFTTTFPMLRDYLTSGDLPLIIGQTGLPRQALYPLWGEASWNGYGTFYYMYGFMGYLLLGLYFRRFAKMQSWTKTLAIALPAYLIGFGITFGGFIRRVMEMCDGNFPACGGIEKAVWWETTWTNDTLGVALMTIGMVMLMRKFTASGTIYNKVLLPISKASYGMYLAHMLVLSVFSEFYRDSLGIAGEGVLGAWTTPLQIVSTAVSTFIIVGIVTVIIQRIPKVGKYIMG